MNALTINKLAPSAVTKIRKYEQDAVGYDAATREISPEWESAIIKQAGYVLEGMLGQGHFYPDSVAPIVLDLGAGEALIELRFSDFTYKFGA